MRWCHIDQLRKCGATPFTNTDVSERTSHDSTSDVPVADPDEIEETGFEIQPATEETVPIPVHAANSSAANTQESRYPTRNRRPPDHFF